MLTPPEALIGTLVEQLFLNIDLVSLVIRLPELTWRQIIIAIALTTLWKIICDFLDRLALRAVRRWVLSLFLG